MLQCAAVCRSVVQCVAVCCSVSGVTHIFSVGLCRSSELSDILSLTQSFLYHRNCVKDNVTSKLSDVLSLTQSCFYARGYGREYGTCLDHKNGIVSEIMGLCQR